jgi:mannose-6-phosphate isomerase-like protein (cupin superfamily)
MINETNFIVLDLETLPCDGNNYEFEGIKFQDTEVSFIWVEMPPGGSVRLHKHPYKEIIIIQDGIAAYAVGSAIIEGHAGQIIIVPADTPHKFMNTGNIPLKQVDIHTSKQFITQWLE